MSVLVKLSNERGEQLRAYAQAEGLGIAEAIGALLKRADAANEVPGFTIIPFRVTDPLVCHFAFGEFTAVLLAEHLARIAGYLDGCADEAGTGGKTLTVESKLGVCEISVARHRRHSVLIVGKDVANGVEAVRTLTLDLARDLAEQLRRAIG